MEINTGAPMIAVKIPIGNSAGETIVLLMVSAINNTTAPNMIDKGNKIL